MPTDVRQALAGKIAERIAARDRGGAVAAVLDAVGNGAITVPVLYEHVLAPQLLQIGEHWQTGELPVWGEHYASGVLHTIVEALYPTVARLAADVPPTGKSVLLACPAGETHDLGLRMLSDRFELAGFKTVLLGADVPTPQIVAAAAALRPDLLVLSASTHFNRVELRDVVDEIRPELPGTDIRATGYAFRLAREGWADAELLDPETFFGLR
jgi:MerR family transcriptional regulator, light-induced transcriptional regulator